MPVNIRPRVNEAKEFLEIAKDFKDSKEIIREALSNSWDAGASYVKLSFNLSKIAGTKKNKIVVEIKDDGAGMTSQPRVGMQSSEIEGFFNLGDSNKSNGSIGSKGHGTKIYYKSSGIKVDTWKSGKHIHAETEVPPWDTLTSGQVPTYKFDERDDHSGRGTHIFIDGFQAKQNEFVSLDNLRKYIDWYTVAGSFANYFDVPRKMSIELKPADSYTSVTLPFGFKFPEEEVDLADYPEDTCKLFGPRRLDCGQNDEGKRVFVDIVGALLGENRRNIVPDTYSHMGLWLAKDYIRIERNNKIFEEIFKGQYYYRSFLFFANCQEFDLTANRNNVRTEQQEYDLAIGGILSYLSEVRDDDFVKAYFDAKKANDDEKREAEAQKNLLDRVNRAVEQRKERLNFYKGRADGVYPSVVHAPKKEPQSEAETALLLQAMISSKIPGVDFQIGDYNTTRGVDLIIEKTDKGIPTLKWAEIVSSLDKIYAWEHPPEGYHVIICYQLGKVKEAQFFNDGTTAKLVRKDVRGRYSLHVREDAIDVYVLKEILENNG